MRKESQNIFHGNTLIEPHHEFKNDTITPRWGGGGVVSGKSTITQ